MSSGPYAAFVLEPGSWLLPRARLPRWVSLRQSRSSAAGCGFATIARFAPRTPAAAKWHQER